MFVGINCQIPHFCVNQFLAGFRRRHDCAPRPEPGVFHHICRTTPDYNCGTSSIIISLMGIAREDSRSRPSVIIVGAGVGGVATAARLAAAGCKVTVVEKNDFSGGRCSLIRRQGYVSCVCTILQAALLMRNRGLIKVRVYCCCLICSMRHFGILGPRSTPKESNWSNANLTTMSISTMTRLSNCQQTLLS